MCLSIISKFMLSDLRILKNKIDFSTICHCQRKGITKSGNSRSKFACRVLNGKSFRILFACYKQISFCRRSKCTFSPHHSRFRHLLLRGTNDKLQTETHERDCNYNIQGINGIVWPPGEYEVAMRRFDVQRKINIYIIPTILLQEK